MAAFAAVGVTYNTTDGTTKTVVATPSLLDLIFIAVATTNITGTAAPTDNNADGLGTYSLIDTGLKNASADELKIYVRNGFIGSATSTTFSHVETSSNGGGLRVMKITGMSKCGLLAVRSFGHQNNIAGPSAPAPVLSLTPLSTNPVFTVINNATSPAGMTVRAGYTAYGDNGYSLPTTGLSLCGLDSGESSATLTWGSSTSNYSSIGVEFDASPILTALERHTRGVGRGLARVS